MFKLKIKLGNAQMKTGHDVSYTIEQVAKSLRAGNCEGKCRDENGNTVGEWKLK